MTFTKGTSGNPRGRPKSWDSMADLIRAELAKPYAGQLTNKERIAAVVVAQAAKGNLAALAWLVDRTEGKIVDRVEQSGTLKTVIEVSYGDGDRDPD